MAVTDFFDRGWRANPAGVAFVAGQRSYTYNEIGELSCRVGNALLARGVDREAKAAVLAGNDPLAWACVLGLWRAGMAWVPVNPASPPEDIQRMLSGFDCEVLFCQDRLLPIADKLRCELTRLHTVIALGEDGQAAAEAVDVVPFASFIESASSQLPEFIPSQESVAGILPTGGTTGPPKGAMNTHRSLSVSALHHMVAAPYSSDEPIVNLVAAPMTHAAGTLTLPCTARGGTNVVMSRMDLNELVDLVERHKVTEMYLPPTVIYRLLEMPGVEQRDFSSLKYLTYGAAPMSTEKLRRAIELFGQVMFQGYGQAEAPTAIAFMRPEEHFRDGKIAEDSRLSATGRPAPMIRVEILNDEGRILSAGQTGEICVRGDLVMNGYYNAPEKTAEAIVGGWLHTGDIGHFDDEGFLHITDRKKDLIITGGFNVYPSEVEQIIWAHPAVQDCAVIGVPHREWGEAVTAVVELKDAAVLTEEELLTYCRPKLGGIKTPKRAVFVEALPRSPNGKVLKKDIREPFWREHRRNI